MAAPTLSTLATFDDIRRCIKVMTDGTAEEEFLRFLGMHERFRLECQSTVQEAQRIQKELDASLKNMADLETKLFHARRLLEMESRARREAEYERDQMEKKIIAVADLLQNERNLKDETKDKLAFLNTLPRKRKSLNRLQEEKYGNDINSTGSFLSDLSITQSEDDFLDVRPNRQNFKKRTSLPKNSKRTRISNGGGVDVEHQLATPSAPPAPQSERKTRRSGKRRSGRSGANRKHNLEINNGVAGGGGGSGGGGVGIGTTDKICATTKVTIPQNGFGPIRAESTIESVPVQMAKEKIVTNQVNVESQEDEQDEADVVMVAAHDEEEQQQVKGTELIGDGPHMTPARRSPLKDAPQMTPTTAVKYSGLANHLIGSPAHNLRSNNMRQHNFATKTFIRSDTCAQCQKKIRFGVLALRCRDCPIRCHMDCRYMLTVACVPTTGTPTIKGPMGYISDYAPTAAPLIPALVVHCVNEIESRGLNEVGIYRVSGAEREIKALKERFLRGKGIPHLTNVDIHVLCGCIKDFLRSLREPLIPTNLWKDFCNAVQNPSNDDIQRDLIKAIEALPPTNRDTLAFLILHFQRIAESPEVRMPMENISRVFGPTIVGYSTADPDQHAIYTEVFTQFSVMENLMKIGHEYWIQYVERDGNKENNGNDELLPELLMRTPSHKNNNKNTKTNNKNNHIYSLYATPMKSTVKKRKICPSPAHSSKK